MTAVGVYEPDRSLKGKVRRRVVRLYHRRPAQLRVDRPMISFTVSVVWLKERPRSPCTRLFRYRKNWPGTNPVDPLVPGLWVIMRI